VVQAPDHIVEIPQPKRSYRRRVAWLVGGIGVLLVAIVAAAFLMRGGSPDWEPATTVGVATHEFLGLSGDIVLLETPLLILETADGTALAASADDRTFEDLELGADVQAATDERFTFTDEITGTIYFILEAPSPTRVDVAEISPGEWLARPNP
jgi:hypothetical protein